MKAAKWITYDCLIWVIFYEEAKLIDYIPGKQEGQIYHARDLMGILDDERWTHYEGDLDTIKCMLL